MEVYLKELVEANKNVDDDSCFNINFRGIALSYTNSYQPNQYSEIEQREINERFFFKYIDYICANPESSLWDIVLDRLFAGTYQCLSINVKSYLFESFDLCSPQYFLPWIDRLLQNEEEMSTINIQAFTSYVDAKRKRGLTFGEIRYALICEPSSKLLELILSKMYRDRLVSKNVWLAIFRLKQQLSITSTQKDLFNDWLGIV